jgi:hypothetical protein
MRRCVEMTIGREEFFRLLPAAVVRFDVEGDLVSWSAGTCAGTLRLVPLPDRRLGSVSVPRHRVDITLAPCTDADGEAFMARFHRAFLRGGG